ncbi:MAG: hypothetical protein CVU48_05330 [Candidatus Cloacimonetes bacterium HGW-Cloacimonetes-1]|jgi:hypothetical protein|nr:MAG: hypothetical protein CVU48_05330 [Candidatus Cloacimonetes bacterium HGW-Cloacimonetes-1]
MKQVKLLLILLVAVIALFVAACGGDDNNNSSGLPTDYTDINPSTADWVIMFADADAKTPQMAMVFWTGDMTTLLTTDTAELLFNGNALYLETYFGMPGLYFAVLDAVEGQTYTVEFKYNGVTKVNTDLKMVYSSNATFPATFNTAESASFSWTMAGNNQYQLAGGSSLRSSDPTDDEMDSFEEIAVSARSYTLGANKLTNFGFGTTYTLEVDQLNYKVVSHVALMSIHGSFADYGYIAKKDQVLSMRTRAMNVYKHMQNR